MVLPTPGPAVLVPAALLLALPLVASPALAAPGPLRATVLAGLERTDAAPGSGASDGLFAGGQLGYDWRLGGLAIGIEGDLGESSATQRLGPRRAAQQLFASLALRAALPVSAQVRGFVRGGLAAHTVGYDSGPAFHGFGWTAGGGAEIDLSARVLLRAEYRYSDYGRTVRGQQFLGGVGLRL